MFRLTPLFVFVIALACEYTRPLRRATQNKPLRVRNNILIGLMGLLLIRLTLFPFVLKVSQWASLNEWGLMSVLPINGWMRPVLTLLLLDYTFYFWHRLNHQIKFLWRFHNVHHVDMDLDVSTASRFHFGELAFSSLYRSAQVVLIGVDPESLLRFETLITIAAFFHHGNVRIPIGFERRLSFFIMTPRLHGIHHSIVQEETDSNYSTVFSWWDRLHGSRKEKIDQDQIVIGVPAYRSAEELGFGGSLLLPFGRQRPWRFANSAIPVRLPTGALSIGAADR